MQKGTLVFVILLMLAALAVAVLLFTLPLCSQHAQPVPTGDTLPTLAQTEATAASETPVTTTQAETESETEVPDEPDDETMLRARELLSEMTLTEKLCQLMIVNPDTIAGENPVTEADEACRKALETYPVGGFSFGQENILGRRQTIEMLQGFNEMSKLGLFFCLDEEGGTVWRVMGNPQMGTPRFGSMYDYRELGGQAAYENAQTIADEIAKLGFNVDFAPVADVWSNPSNTVIGKRAYSDDFTQAAELLPQAVRGFHAGGVACTLKHFPGHGNTVEDSHKGLAIVHRTAQELRAEELLPFKAGIDAGADMVMVGHLLVEDLDAENPATFSYAIVTELLREEFGFDGVVITDALGMGALAEFSEADRCKKALAAGCDLLLGITEPEKTLQALQTAVEREELSEQRIDESVLRILYLKLTRGIIE